MNRRSFVTVTLGAASMVAGLGQLFRKLLPRRFTRAHTTTPYPGKTRPITTAQIRKTAPWSG